ncbi:MAG: methyltransferase domain-containing protein [Candidatus Stahlbacteria bacterium]|nr:MAG: methyltransferase domain-containing protein [Candidatus Stahlbacteria bacterium]
MLTIDMLDRLACPECKNLSIELKSSAIENNKIIKGEIVCPRCHRQYPINDGIPNMLPDELRLKKIPKESIWREWGKRLGSYRHRMKGWTEENSRSIIPVYEESFSYFYPIRGSALEIGCGNGVVRHFLNRDVEYWGTDPDKDWILHPLFSYTRNIFPCLNEPFLFIQGVGEYLPFKDESFDNVIITATLDHVNSPAQVFEESYRVLKDKGQMLLSVGIGEWGVNKRKIISILANGFNRLLKGELISLTKGVFRRLFVHAKPDLFFSLDEIIHLFRRFSGLEIKNYDSCLKFFKAKKKQASYKSEV